MVNIIQINNEWLPEPNGDIDITPEKEKTEKATEAGTTYVTVTRPTKLTITASWSLSGDWAEKFRAWQAETTVKVKIYYPYATTLTEYTCQLEMKEKQITKARGQVTGGLYEVAVEMTEI